MEKSTPRIVGIGGTLAPQSSTARLLRHVLERCEAAGATTATFTGDALELPFYMPGRTDGNASAEALVSAMRSADAIILSSPGYHGSISGLLKNALDYTEDMAGDARPYFEDLPVGLITAGAGWQGANTTLATLRAIVHALRGWPTPLGIAVNSRTPLFDEAGALLDPGVGEQMNAMAAQLIGFVTRSRAADGR